MGDSCPPAAGPMRLLEGDPGQEPQAAGLLDCDAALREHAGDPRLERARANRRRLHGRRAWRDGTVHAELSHAECTQATRALGSA
jgi:hypothetical protein